MVKTLIATGAYGRKANREDWEAGKDFQDHLSGRYFSIRDVDYLRSIGYTSITFRFWTDPQRIFEVTL